MTILGLQGFPLVKTNDDIATMILRIARSQGIRIADRDIIVIGHKIISKSEGRIVRLSQIKSSIRAARIARRTSKDPRLVQLVLDESKRIIKAARGILLVETKQGIVCMNAGIDKSNVENHDAYCLLPRNPSRSADRIARQLRILTRKHVRVMVTDTYSRPFRTGQSEFAIGLSRLDPFVDYRGTKDLFGNILKFKRVSVADELASAAELVMGQGAEGVPVAIIRGVARVRHSRRGSAHELIMPRNRDLFRGAL